MSEPRPMSVDLHRQAEQRFGNADRAKSAGDYATAAVEMAMAGLRETEALEQIPLERSKTRGVIALSAVASYVHAADYAQRAGLDRAAQSYRDSAAVYARKYRGFVPAKALPEWARHELARTIARAEQLTTAQAVELLMEQRCPIDSSSTEQGTEVDEVVSVYEECKAGHIWILRYDEGSYVPMDEDVEEKLEEYATL